MAENGMIAHERMLIGPGEIIRVVRNTLGYIDERLMEHGERVAYIAGMTASYGGLRRAIRKDLLLVLCMLHDIGAYKTEEIDDMVSFEVNDVYEHAIYGYLFLRYLTPLSDAAEAVLYHHLPYDRLCREECAYRDYAQLIHLADRIDILLQHGKRDFAPILKSSTGTQFDPEMVDAFLRADSARDICGSIRSGAYRAAVEQAAQQFTLEQTDMFGYLEMLVFAIDFRSAATVTHTVTATAVAEELGRLFGLDETESAKLSSGAFLHDVGKIGIPVAILEKPGRLTDEEMDLMRTHVVMTEKIIRGVVSDDICDIAVRHHEKMDGSGYVHGLTGADLTLSQRILAVADVVSALAGRRSYKEPMPAGEVCGILSDMRDRGKLCPEVCDRMLAHYDEVMRVAAERGDAIIQLYGDLMARHNELMTDPLFAGENGGA